MTTPNFPNGFESWHKTHFEVVEVLCYMRELDDDASNGNQKNFAEYADRSATDYLYTLAFDLTNKYEAENKGKQREVSLFDAIEEFVWREVRAAKGS